MTRWSDEDTREFLNTILDYIKKIPLSNDNAITSEAYTKAGIVLKNKFNKDQMQNKMSDLKKTYSAYKPLATISGLGWDAERNCIGGTDEFWDDYISSHPAAGKFRNKTFVWYDLMDSIFSGTLATGVMATTTPKSSTKTKNLSNDESPSNKKMKSNSSTNENDENDEYKDDISIDNGLNYEVLYKYYIYDYYI